MVFAHLSRGCVSIYLKKFINKRGHETLKEREGAMVVILMKRLYHRVGTKEGIQRETLGRFKGTRGMGRKLDCHEFTDREIKYA